MDLAQLLEQIHTKGIETLGIAGSDVPLVAVPDSFKVESLERFLAAPRFIQGTSKLYRYTDFVEYVKDFGISGRSRIFVKPDLAFTAGGELATAYLDFPEPGSPEWTNHSAILVVQPSLEYQLLTKLEGRGLIPQDEFALAIRDLSRFCSSQTAADLLEMVKTLTLSSKGEFATIEDDFSGSVRFGYNVQVQAKSEATSRKNVEVPQTITFTMALLGGAEPVAIDADFLYRVPSGADEKVKMGIRLPDRKFIEQQVLESMAASLNTDTGLTVSVGITTVA